MGRCSSPPHSHINTRTISGIKSWKQSEHPQSTANYHTLSLVTELFGGVNQRFLSRVGPESESPCGSLQPVSREKQDQLNCRSGCHRRGIPHHCHGSGGHPAGGVLPGETEADSEMESNVARE